MTWTLRLPFGLARMATLPTLLLLLLLQIALVLLSATFSAYAQPGSEKNESLRQEEQEDYYRKWLNEDVKYIISDDEKSIFSQLATDDEKDQFIEQFWRRRDPDARTAVNEFKEEHYRRIAYANDHFESGFPGWMTDRGRIYIIHGPPDSIDRNPSGGAYQRPMHEGGGATATFPFELWTYRRLEGIGDGIELEFVDKTWTGEYKLALSPSEKDVFLNTPGHGMTLAEQVGLATKHQRLTLSPAVRENYPLMQHRIQDSPFARYETFSKVKAPAEIKYPELKEIVSANVSYQNLAFRVQSDFFRLSRDRFLVPITVALSNPELDFRLQGAFFEAKVGIYGLITNIAGQVAEEFEEDIIVRLKAADLEKGMRGRTLFQKVVILQGRTRYKLSMVAKEVRSGKVGVIKQAMIPPSGNERQLQASSLLLADYIQQLEEIPGENDSMFVLGDVKVRPSIEKTFPLNGALGLYLQVYNALADQSTGSPSMQVTYRLLQDGKVISEFTDREAKTIRVYTDQRIVITTGIPLRGLVAGRYRVEVEVNDQIAQRNLTVSDVFQVAKP